MRASDEERRRGDVEAAQHLGLELGVLVVAGGDARRLGDGGGEAELLRADVAEGGEDRDDAAARLADDRVQPLVELGAVLPAELRVDVVLAVVDVRHVAEGEAVVLQEPEVALVVVARKLGEEQPPAHALKLLRVSLADVGELDRVEDASVEPSTQASHRPSFMR